MNLYDISILKTDINQKDDDNVSLYDLTEPTFVTKDLLKFEMVVTKDQEMRIDLISNEIYQSVDYADFLLNINDIDNPLNIKAGDIIKYPPFDHLEYYKIAPSTNSDNRKKLLSPNKANQKDPNRQQFIENDYQLNPTMLDNPGNPISTANGKITISPIR